VGEGGYRQDEAPGASMMIEVNTIYFPCIVRLGGKTYAAGGSLIEVPDGTTLRNIRWTNEKPIIERFQAEILGEFSSSRDPDTTYTVKRLVNGSILCNCAGFQFRRKCRHIDEVSK
jgi:hypothetical protein